MPALTEFEIASRINTGIDLFIDQSHNSYTREDLFAHMVALIKDATAPAAFHKEKVEQVLYWISDVRKKQKYYWQTKKGLGECKAQEQLLDNKVAFLLRNGYTIERFTNTPPTQTTAF